MENVISTIILKELREMNIKKLAIEIRKKKFLNLTIRLKNRKQKMVTVLKIKNRRQDQSK